MVSMCHYVFSIQAFIIVLYNCNYVAVQVCVSILISCPKKLCSPGGRDLLTVFKENTSGVSGAVSMKR